MPVFRKEAKRTYAGRARTDSERHQRKAERLLESKLKTSETAQAEYIKYWLGVDIPVLSEADKIRNQTEVIVEKARQRIIEEGLKKLETDPAYKELRNWVIAKETGINLAVSTVNPRRVPDSEDAFIARLDTLAELEDRVSSRREQLGSSRLGSQLTPQSVAMFISQLTKLIEIATRAAAPSEQLYEVIIDGRLIEMSEEQYRTFIIENQMQPTKLDSLPMQTIASKAVSKSIAEPEEFLANLSTTEEQKHNLQSLGTGEGVALVYRMLAGYFGEAIARSASEAVSKILAEQAKNEKVG